MIPPSLLFKLLGIGKWLRSIATGTLRWITASTTHLLIAACAVLLIGNVWQHRQIGKWKRANETLKVAAKALETASDANKAAQIAQVKAVEAKSAAIAKETDHAYAIELAAARTAAERYADSHRVRAERVYRSAPGSPTEDRGPALPADPAPGPELVAITREDFSACTALTPYALGAHKWATDLVRDGLAKPLEVPEVGF